LFDYIYPTILNKREIVVSLENLNDAVNFTQNLKGELGRLMEQEEIVKEFISIADVSKLMLLQSWKPLLHGNIIKETATKSNYEIRSWTKRSRNDLVTNNRTKTNYPPVQAITLDNLGSPRTYSAVVNNENTIISSVTANGNEYEYPGCSITSKMSIMQDTIDELVRNKELNKKELGELKNEIKKMNNKIEDQATTSNETIKELFGNLSMMLHQSLEDAKNLQKNEYTKRKLSNHKQSTERGLSIIKQQD
jgi:hypothetical protein